MNRRKQIRIQFSDIFAEISDGQNCYSATIRNISISGLEVENVSTEINHKASTLFLLVSHGEQDFKLRAIPRWVNENGETLKAGLRIFDAPISWMHFVDSIDKNN